MTTWKNDIKFSYTIVAPNIIGSMSTSLTMSITGFGLMAVPITASVAITTRIAIEVVKKENNSAEIYTLSNKTFEDIRKLYRKDSEGFKFYKYITQNTKKY